MTNPSGNRWIFMLAAVLSLITHIALAAIFTDKNDDAQIAGGAVVSVAMMGEASLDQVMIGELKPILENSQYERAASSTLLQSEKTNEVLTSTIKQITAIELKSVELQYVKANPLKELKATRTNAEIASLRGHQSNHMFKNKPEQLEITTAPISPQSALQSRDILDNQNQKIQQIKLKQPIDDLERNVNVDRLSAVAKPIEQLDAQMPSDPIPLPQFRPINEYQKEIQTAKLTPKQPLKKAKRHPEKKKTTKKNTSGHKGKNKTSAKKGVQTGKAKKGKVGSKKRGQSKTIGDGSITNYKGKVRRKIARRFNPKTRTAKRDAVVSFTIGRNGSANSIKLARSSGNSKLDRAALSAVKKASPFPALPSGNSKLAFSVPLNAR